MTTTPATDPTTTLTEIVLPGVVDPDGLIVNHRPVPIPASGQALVELLASGVSFAENAMRRGRYPGQPKFPFVLGYDLVGTVTDVGPRIDRSLVGQRVASVVKTGGWSTHTVHDTRDLIPVPETLDPAAIEAVLLNGITAWQMLHRKAHARAGQTILVHGASGGVGTVLVQLARHAGIRVIGTGSPRHHDALRALGIEPFDYRDPALVDHVRALAPSGVDAVFDNIGGASFSRSFAQLAPGGTLIGYGTAGLLDNDDTGNVILIIAGILGRFAQWSALPNHGRSATFYNFWAGKTTTPARFRRRLATDLHHVLDLVAHGQITAPVADRIPLREASRALTLAQSGTGRGKVVLVP
ncbi:MAG: zinc-binding dehydrogenase [Solirubrobacterales bacterium]|nr:zinc-binding dehydrogenase [Solirubrobacterales bacterium]